MDALLNGEIRQIVKVLYQIGGDLIEQRRDILEQGARPVVEAARQHAPVGTSIHYRYNTPKVAKGIRAPKGSGAIVATYLPGNLRSSIKALFFKRAQSSVFIGPVRARNPKGTFGPDYSFTYEGGTVSAARADGYYAHLVEFGVPDLGIPPQPFMRPAAASAGPEGQRIIVEKLRAAVLRAAQKYSTAKGR